MNGTDGCEGCISTILRTSSIIQKDLEISGSWFDKIRFPISGGLIRY